jgi:threonine aldolase
MADKLRDTLALCGYSLLVESRTNQVFPILPDKLLDVISKSFTFSEMERVDDTSRVVRFCTSWATKEEDVCALCALIENFK